MQTDIYYRDITRTENLENYLMEKVEKILSEYLKYDSDAHVTVRVETDRHRTNARRPNYLCEILVKTSWLKNPIKVQKSDPNFRTCVAKCGSALKVILSKQSSLKQQHRRRDRALETDAQITDFEWLNTF